MAAILAVIINLPIGSTDGVFEGKKRQCDRTTEPRHSARQQHALGVLAPVLYLVSYCRMSASLICGFSLWPEKINLETSGNSIHFFTFPEVHRNFLKVIFTCCVFSFCN